MCWKGFANSTGRPSGATLRPSNVAKPPKPLPREDTMSSVFSSGSLQEVWGNLFIQLIFRQEGTCLQKGDGLNLRMIPVAPQSRGPCIQCERPQAMYGANFAYFDPNIWWNEDEMRKQVEQLNGCFVLTGKVRVCCRGGLKRAMSLCVCVCACMCVCAWYEMRMMQRNVPVPKSV